MLDKTTQKKISLSNNRSVRVRDLARILNLPVTRIIKELMKNNIYVTINEEIDPETAAVISEDLGYKVKIEEEKKEGREKKFISKSQEGGKLKFFPRPPVVVVMGHVDHGKTTLLDRIRKTNVAEEESGGITQSIGAYQIEYKNKLVTFIDTPGHEMFVKMRERGAHLTDIAILVVAADDGVKPQTREALKHIQKAGIPFIVAINKIDIKSVNVKKVKNDLAQEGVQIEEWGGKVPVQEISAKTGQGIDYLLDLILLVAEMEKLKAPLEGPALGTVIESNLSPQRGPEVVLLVQAGTFRVGDVVRTGDIKGKMRKMENYQGENIKEAVPSTPVKVIGFSSLPPVGDFVEAGIKSEEEKGYQQETAKEKALLKIAQRAKKPRIKRLNLIIKADTHGSEEAILESMAKIDSEEIVPFIVQEGVGNITESDVLKAHITGSKLLGFKVQVAPVALRLSKQLGIKINTYDLIYEFGEAVKKGLEEMLEEEEKVIELGKLKVLAIFRTEKDKMIVGGRVTQGVVPTNSNIRIKRDENLIGEGKLGELQSGKQKVGEVKSGSEAGIKFLGSTKIEVGDILEFYKIEKKKKTL